MRVDDGSMPGPVRAALVVCGVLILTHMPAAQQGGIDEFFDRFTADWVRTSPNQATSTRFFSGDEQAALERQLTPLTASWRAERRDLARHGLDALAAFDPASLTEAQRVSADLMRWQLGIVIEAGRYAGFDFPLDQFAGANVGLPGIALTHPLVTDQDADNYLARLRQVGTRLDEATAEAVALAGQGRVPPRFIVRTTIAQMEQFLASAPADSPFVATFVERLSATPGIAEDARERHRAEAERIVAAQVYPAWRRAVAALESMETQTTDAPGLMRFPGGLEAYAFHLRRFTSTNLTADEIHAIGLREVARIETEMDGILRALGRSTGSVRERTAQLQKDLAYPTDDAGRGQIMADIDAFIRDAQERSQSQFARTPRAAVVARPYPRFREETAAASYTAPSPDGSRPGVFQMPLRADRMTRFGLRTLVYHETVPGHHFQLGLELENDANPRFRRIRAFGGISAFSEGWALYAEQLAAENGWYDGDLEGRLGQLDAALFRARRLVVDTGLHAKGWTRQQAIDYGIPASEVDRYVVNPGQACAYMIGQLKLVELRDRVRSALGARFDPKVYHDLVLSTGTVPLSLLEAIVDRFIAARR